MSAKIVAVCTLIVCLLVAAAGGDGVVMEKSFSTADCTDGGTVTNSWKLESCSGVGNQPPFHVSENVTVDHLTAVFSYYIGPNCTGAPYEVSNQTLNSCTYFTGTTYTMFVHENGTGYQPLQRQ